MSDAAPFSADFSGDLTDEELIFDEPDTAANVIPAAPDAGSPEPRRVARRGRKSKEAAASPEPVPAPSVPTRSAGAAAAAAEEPAGAPAPFPPQGADPAGSKSSLSQRLLLATVALALVTSTASLGGLIMVSRTLAHADVDRTKAAEAREAFASVPTMIAHLDAASARLDGATARLSTTPALAAVPAAPLAPASPTITMADLHREIDALKLALGQRQPEGLRSLDGMTRDGFSEVTTKLDRLSGRIDQLTKRGAAKP
jgi:hypothetical protein